jgi:3'(2'), 5'-bisphosphate nucleotidase
MLAAYEGSVLLEAELAFAERLARDAGELALKYYDTKLIVEEKPDSLGPVTEADRQVNAFVLERLRQRFPRDAILAEESEADPARLSKDRVWTVDPIDGTREFVGRTGAFSAMIGLTVAGRPMLGVLYQPTAKKLFSALAGGGAWLEDAEGRRRLRVSQRGFAELRMVVATPWRGHRVEQIRQALGVTRMISMGSIGLKLAMIAAGDADLYVNATGRLGEWDTCAAEVILTEAGGVITDLEGRALHYNTGEINRRRGVVASNGRCHRELLEVISALRAQSSRESQ